MTKSVFIKTYGCQMNAYDSARMAELLAPHGYREAADSRDADLIVLNTCHIRDKASEKVYSELGRLRAQKAERGTMIAVAGCVAQAESGEILRRAPHVDVVVGPQTFHRLPELIAKVNRGAGAQCATDFAPEPKFDAIAAETPARVGVSAFLTIQEGCDKFCTFCVVPYTRGAEFSRPVGEVIAEAERLVAGGAVEITLLGQNVNAYHGVAGGLAELIRRLARIDSLRRIRYTTSHPRDMTDDLITLHGEEAKLMPYLHLPVQSGSDRVLEAMNRGYGARDYHRLVERLRRARPDIALSSDLIVGFPGESESDFAATLDLVRAVDFAAAYSFKYSPRPGTPAASMDHGVDEGVKDERLARLQALLREQQTRFNQAARGRVMPVLIEREGRHPGQRAGRSPYLQAVHVRDGRAAMGAIVDVQIDEVLPNSLSGSVVFAPAREEMTA